MVIDQIQSSASLLPVHSHSWPTDSASSLGLERSVERSPRILLVDDDPLFCSRIRRTARKLRLDVTVCQSFSDLLTISRQSKFDVAVLDYFFSDELTAVQLSQLLEKSIPLVLTSNTDATQLSQQTWPSEIRSFVHKKAGPEAILAEALMTVQPTPFLSPISSPFVFGSVQEAYPWWYPIAAALTVVAALVLFYLTLPSNINPWNWDTAQSGWEAIPLSLRADAGSGQGGGDYVGNTR